MYNMMKEMLTCVEHYAFDKQLSLQSKTETFCDMPSPRFFTDNTFMSPFCYSMSNKLCILKPLLEFLLVSKLAN